MTIRRHLHLAGAAALLLGGALQGATYEELSQEINRVAVAQIELQHAARERNERWARELASERHDTPAMKTTRATIKRLQNELLEAEESLKQQFAELPAFRDEAAKAKADREELRRLDSQRQGLLRQRNQLLEQTKPKPKAAAPAADATP